MSNPTGDALVAIGIEDTQKLSVGKLRRALLKFGGCKRFVSKGRLSNAGEIALAVVVGAVTTAFLL